MIDWRQRETGLKDLLLFRRTGQLLDRFSPGLRRIAGNTGWLMLDRILRIGVGAILSIWMARYLGPAQYGSLNFATSFVLLLGVLPGLGLEVIIVRETVRDIAAAPEILGTTLALRLAASVLTFMLVVAAVRAILPDDMTALVLVSILGAGLIFQPFDTIDSFFQAQVQSRYTVWAKTSAFLVFALVKIALIRSRAPLWTFAAAGLGEIVLGAAGLAIAYWAGGGRILDWRLSVRRARMLLGHSWPLILSSMAVLTYLRIDTVMLKIMQGDAVVGLYAAATRVSEVWIYIPTSIVSSVSPAIIRSRENQGVYYYRLARLFALMTPTAILISAAITLMSGWIIRVLYSGTYSGAATVLAIHVWALVFTFLGTAQVPWDVAEGLLRLSLWRTSSGAIMNIALNWLLIPKYSARGAALATVVSYGVSAVAGNLFSARTRPIFFMQLRSFFPRELWSRPA